MEDDLCDDGEGYEYLESTFLPDLRIDQEKSPNQRDLPVNRKLRGEKDIKGDRGADKGDKLDLIYSGNGVMIFGKHNQKPEDRGAIMIIPGINESTILEMGRLGILKGKAKEIYEKFK